MNGVSVRGEAIKAAWGRLPGNAQGMIWMTLSSAAFSIHDATAKALGLHYSVFEITFLRFATSIVLMIPILWWVGFDKLKTRHPVMHGVRASLTILAQMAAYYALAHMLLADVTGIAFTRPLWVTLLAVLLLGEKVNLLRWGALAVGFAGMVIMVRPGTAEFTPATLSAILSSMGFAAVGVVVRRYSASESTVAWMFYYMLAGVILSLPGTIVTWQVPTWIDLALALLVAVIAITAQACFILAFTVGEASVVGPVDYTRLVYATLIGMFVFSEFPEVTTWVGAGIIIAATTVVARHEARARPRKTAGG